MATAEDDSEPYMNLRVLVVEVDGRCARVMRQIFARSQIFQDMFAMPHEPGEVFEGEDESHPLKLTDVKWDDFKVFIRAAIAGEINDSPLPKLTCLQWAAVHNLSARWEMDHLNQKIYAAIHTQFWADSDAAERLYLAIKFSRHEWLDQTVKRLVAREDPLSPEHMELLGFSISARIAVARESLFRGLATARHEAIMLQLGNPTATTCQQIRSLSHTGPPVVNGDGSKIARSPVTVREISAIIARCEEGYYRLQS